MLPLHFYLGYKLHTQFFDAVCSPLMKCEIYYARLKLRTNAEVAVF